MHISDTELRKRVLLSMLTWISAYVGMWLARMALVSLFLHQDAFSSTFDSFFKWVGIKPREKLAFIGPASAIIMGLKTIFTKAHILLMFFTLMIFLAMLLVSIKRQLIQKPDFLILSMGALPLVWMIVSSKAATWHIFFQYRSLTVFFLAIFVSLTSIFKGRVLDDCTHKLRMK